VSPIELGLKTPIAFAFPPSPFANLGTGTVPVMAVWEPRIFSESETPAVEQFEVEFTEIF